MLSTVNKRDTHVGNAGLVYTLLVLGTLQLNCPYTIAFREGYTRVPLGNEGTLEMVHIIVKYNVVLAKLTNTDQSVFPGSLCYRYSNTYLNSSIFVFILFYI